MIAPLVKEQRDYFASEKTLSYEARKEALMKIYDRLIRYRPEFNEAFKKDYNKCEFDVLSTEYYLVLEECLFHLKHLKREMRPKKVSTSLVNFPSRGRLLQEPYGVCLIIAPWNYPFQLAMEPLMGCLAAGNTALVKPASAAKNVSMVLFKMFEEFGNPGLVQVILGSHEENADLLDQRYDYIFFTGGAETGKEILSKAAPHLTPCSLELGGKSPCIIDEDADLPLAARRAVWGKFLNAGQTCVAPDYFYVHEKVHDAFLELVKKDIREFYYPNGSLSDDFPYLINEKHVLKEQAFLDPQKIVAGGHLEGRLLEPTVMDHVTWEDKIMSDEIFGPIMPILTFTDLDVLLPFIRGKEKPLAFYYFSKDRKKAEKVLSSMPFGGGCWNDTIMHLTNEKLPFGGVGRSGMGSYHGYASFRTFSHQKSVLLKGKYEIMMKYPPYNEKKLALLKKLAKTKD